MEYYEMTYNELYRLAKSGDKKAQEELCERDPQPSNKEAE